MSNTDGLLPTLPSALIRLALADLALVESDPRYIVDMSVYHKPINGTCSVCLAGAVMAKTLDSDPGARLGVLDFFGGPTGHLLSALNSLRMGLVSHALRKICLPACAVPDRDVTAYGEDPVAFRRGMEELASELEGVGL